MMNRKGLKTMVMLLMVAVVLSCSSGKDSKEVALEGSDFLVTIKTDMGEMKAILYDKTPQHKENFLKLVREGFYDSLLFHRVMQNFMIQGGDPESKNAPAGQVLGSGGPGYTVPAEFVPEYFHEKGALAAARKPDQVNPEKESSGSQFYIVHGIVSSREELEININLLHQKAMECVNTQPQLDLSSQISTALTQAQQTRDQKIYIDKLVELRSEIEKTMNFDARIEIDPRKLEKYSTIGGFAPLDDEYTVFGKVIQGLDIIDKIAAVPTPGDPGGNRPFEDIRMYISVEEMSKKEIAEKYGNPYL